MYKKFIALLLGCVVLTGCGLEKPQAEADLDDYVYVGKKDSVDVDENEDEKEQSLDIETVETAIDTVKTGRDLYKNFKLVKAGNSKKVIAGVLKDALLSSYSDEPLVIEDNFQYFDNCYINTGTFMDYTFGNYDGETLCDGAVVSFDTDDFIFTLGTIRDGKLNGWCYVYDLYSMDTLLVNYENGKETGGHYELGVDDTWSGGSGLDITKTKNGCKVKSDDSTWVFNFIDNIVRFKSGNMDFDGNFLDFTVSVGDTKYTVGAMDGIICESDKTYCLSDYDTEDMTKGLHQVIEILNDVDKTMVDVAADNAAEVIMGVSPFGVIDELFGGAFTEELSDALVEEYKVLFGDTDRRTAKEIQLHNHRLSVRSETFYDYGSYLISGKRPDKSLKTVPDDKKSAVVTKNIEKKLKKEQKEYQELAKQVAKETQERVKKQQEEYARLAKKAQKEAQARLNK